MTKSLAFFLSCHVGRTRKMATLLARFRGTPPRQQKFKPVHKNITGADISLPFSTGNEVALSDDLQREWLAAQQEERGWKTKDCPRCDEFRNELDRADDRQVEHEKITAELTHKIADLGKQEHCSRQHINKQESRIEKMAGAQIDMETQLLVAQSKVREAAEEAVIVRRAVYETEQRCDSLANELRASTKANEQLRERLKASSATNNTDDHEGENAKLKADNAALVRQLKVARAELQDARKNHAEQAPQNVAPGLEDLENENVSLLAENAALKRQVKKGRDDLLLARTTSSKPESDSEEELHTVRAENDKLRSQLETAQVAIKILKSERNDPGTRNQDSASLGTSKDGDDPPQSESAAASASIDILGTNPGLLMSRTDAVNVRPRPSSRNTHRVPVWC